LSYSQEWKPWEILSGDIWKRYDYLLVCGFTQEIKNKDYRNLEFIDKKGIWALYENRSTNHE